MKEVDEERREIWRERKEERHSGVYVCKRERERDREREREREMKKNLEF